MDTINLKEIKKFVRRELVLVIAVVLGVGSCFYSTPRLDYIDWDVLSVLWALMLVVEALKSIKFLDWAAIELLNKCRSFRQVVVALLGITFFSSMLVTNDVALLTFVPLALVIGKTVKMDMPQVIILQTLAANLGSMFTPMGNPQNLFLYVHYGFTAAEFFDVMLLPTLFSVVFMGIIVLTKRDQLLQLTLPALPKPERLLSGMYLLLLALNVVAVLHVVDKYFALGITIIIMFVLDRALFKRVDYSLLITFIGFFIFIGNISHTDIVQYLQASVLGSATGTYLAGCLSSQFISNVPAAMLLAGLTKEAEALLLGVNIGGMGTLIASMASVISYKLFAVEHPYQASSYLRMFLYYNFMGLLLIGGLTYVCVIM